MKPVSIRYLYDRHTGKLKFKYRIRLFMESHTAHLFIVCCLILFTVVLFGSVMLGFNPDSAPFLASFAMMAAMFFGAFHIKMSQNGHRRKRYKPDTLTDEEVKERMDRRREMGGTDDSWKDTCGT